MQDFFQNKATTLDKLVAMLYRANSCDYDVIAREADQTVPPSPSGIPGPGEIGESGTRRRRWRHLAQHLPRDRCHPNSKGHAKVADWLAEELADLLPKP